MTKRETERATSSPSVIDSAMLDPELLEILVCPETKQSVTLADDELLDRVNRSVDQGTLVNRGGETIEDKMDGGLVREDRAVMYPVRDGIPIMLVDEAVSLQDI